jgi:hypothetical protein
MVKAMLIFDMPQGCGSCPILDPSGYCMAEFFFKVPSPYSVDDWDADWEQKRHEKCPLREWEDVERIDEIKLAELYWEMQECSDLISEKTNAVNSSLFAIFNAHQNIARDLKTLYELMKVF